MLTGFFQNNLEVLKHFIDSTSMLQNEQVKFVFNNENTTTDMGSLVKV